MSKLRYYCTYLTAVSIYHQFKRISEFWFLVFAIFLLLQIFIAHIYQSHINTVADLTPTIQTERDSGQVIHSQYPIVLTNCPNIILLSSDVLGKYSFSNQ